jgi:hypothetical protein
MSEIEKITLLPENDSHMKLVKEWNNQEIYLRGCMVKARIAKYNIESSDDSRKGKGFVPELERVVQEAYSLENPKEKERMFDLLRWRWLEDAELGYLFKLENLCIYKFRLLINDKWSSRIPEVGRKNIEQLLASKAL